MRTGRYCYYAFIWGLGMIYTNKQTNTTDKEAGIKYDSDKVMMNLVDYEHVEDIGKVLTYGATKYGAHTWKNLDNAKERYFAALMRHVIAWRKGEACDEESGLSHLAHAAANIMFLAHFDREGENG